MIQAFPIPALNETDLNPMIEKIGGFRALPEATRSETINADYVVRQMVIELKMLKSFADDRGRLYQAIAEKVGVSYDEVQSLSMKLQQARLARIFVVPFNGCRLFLNDRGRQVKRAAEIYEGLQVRCVAE